MIDTLLQATISDVQRFSTDDGPGIRTTVFFKGCNLKCAWCHNPETQSEKPQILYYKNRCTHCGACEKVCKFALQTCVACGECANVCPNYARQISGKTYTVQTLFDELKKDALFYQTSGGGVTFSGGECMLQINFLENILRLCKQNGISTAVDTAGAVAFSQFERILPYTDLFLYDIKAATNDMHKRYVGADNTLIKENLKKLCERGARVWVRIPTIVGVNATDEEMRAINALIKDCGKVERVELLPYHTLGGHKYEALGRQTQAFERPTDEQLQTFSKLFDCPVFTR